MALIRYPGSKEKLAGEITRRFPDEVMWPVSSSLCRWEYREPFFGAGAIGFVALKTIHCSCPIRLNDIDPAMVALWTSVRDHPGELCELISGFEPGARGAADAFYRFKEEDGRTDLPPWEIGFRKLVLHRTSFSGLGYMAGGPIGGGDQPERPRRDDGRKTYAADCRWTSVRETMKRDIAVLGKRMRGFTDFRFTNLDFEECVRGAPANCFIYADPPYVAKGPELYKHSLDESDHVRLRDALRDCEAAWVLSYDDHELVRDLYGSWTDIEDVHITYTTATARTEKRPKNREVVISPRRGVRSAAGSPAEALAC